MINLSSSSSSEIERKPCCWVGTLATRKHGRRQKASQEEEVGVPGEAEGDTRFFVVVRRGFGTRKRGRNEKENRPNTGYSKARQPTDALRRRNVPPAVGCIGSDSSSSRAACACTRLSRRSPDRGILKERGGVPWTTRTAAEYSRSTGRDRARTPLTADLDRNASGSRSRTRPFAESSTRYLPKYTYNIREICDFQRNRKSVPNLKAGSVCGVRMVRPPGIGKSHRATELGEALGGLYRKSPNMWWDGYAGEPVCILDDVDLGHVCMAPYVKIWADNNPLVADRGWPAGRVSRSRKVPQVVGTWRRARRALPKGPQQVVVRSSRGTRYPSGRPGHRSCTCRFTSRDLGGSLASHS